jgi:hypothetical protein
MSAKADRWSSNTMVGKAAAKRMSLAVEAKPAEPVSGPVPIIGRVGVTRCHAPNAWIVIVTQRTCRQGGIGRRVWRRRAAKHCWRAVEHRRRLRRLGS